MKNLILKIKQLLMKKQNKQEKRISFVDILLKK